MITTPNMIELLVANAHPVKRLRPAYVRTALWLLLAALLFVLIGISQGMRPDLSLRLQDAGYLTGIVASLITGVLAAAAAFLVSLPGRSRLWLLLPLPTAVVWAASITFGCLTAWISLGPNGLRLGEAARCFATLALTSVPLSLALLLMLRHAALFRPTLVATLGSLSVAALAASALSLFHDLDASMMVLIWNFGVAAVMIGAGSLLGSRMLAWVGPELITRKV